LVGKFLRDTWLVFQRSMLLTVRNPTWIVVGLAQPLYYLLLFAPLLKNVRAPGMAGGDAAFAFFIPGLLTQLALFGTLFVGFGLIGELRDGVIERMRVTPVSRFALLLGRALRDVVTLLVQAIVLVVISLPFGLHVHFAPLLLVLGLMILLALMGASASYAVALILKSEDALAPLANGVAMPILLLSGVFLPMAAAPGWLQGLSRANPLRYAVDASRDLFAGHVTTAAVYEAVIILLVLTVAAVIWAARRFARSVA
jgi:ABC-2 type transport system permease protein